MGEDKERGIRNRMKDKLTLIEGLKQVPVILSEFVKSIPQERMDLRRGEGFWTIAEHVSHLAQVQPMMLERLERFAAEKRPEFIPYIPGEGEEESDTPDRMKISDALEQFESYRDKQVSLLEKADDAVWKTEGIHPEYERYSMYILVRHILMHDYWHMYRMEELWLTRDAYLTKVE